MILRRGRVGFAMLGEMSSFESYFFQGYSRILEPSEGKFADGFSSRIEVRGRQAYVEYHYDGGGKNWKSMLKDGQGGFDAMLFTWQWFGGTIAFRFPSGAVWRKGLKEYEVEGDIKVSDSDGVLVEVSIFSESPGEWCEFVEAWGNPFEGFYEETLRGDFRWLYVCWLSSQGGSYPGKPSQKTPVVPQQMDELEERHWQLVDFFQNRRELVEAAVELAPSYDDEGMFREWDEWDLGMGRRDREEINSSLSSSPWEGLGVYYRMMRANHREGVGDDCVLKRGVRFEEIEKRTEEIEKEKVQENMREKEERRVGFLAKVKPWEERLWDRADELISEKNTKSYDGAVRVMAVLKLLGCHEGKWESYLEGVVGLKERYPRLNGLHRRMEDAYLFREDDKPLVDWEPEREGFDEDIFEL
ncbi:MAG: hypothetical protein ACJAVK_003148 [Akkermansiaceae bacterium]